MLRLFPRLDERRARPAGIMSGGEQQMVAVGRALLQGEKIRKSDLGL